MVLQNAAGLADGLGDTGLVVRPHQRSEGGEVFLKIGVQFLEKEATQIIDANGAGFETDGGHGFDGA